MQIKVELSNLRGDQRAALMDDLETSQTPEVLVRATVVETDSFGRTLTLVCEDAEVRLVDAGRASRRWQVQEALDEPRTRRQVRFADRDSENPVPPQMMVPGPDPIRLPAPIMPAWANEIGDTSRGQAHANPLWEPPVLPSDPRYGGFADVDDPRYPRRPGGRG